MTNSSIGISLAFAIALLASSTWAADDSSTQSTTPRSAFDSANYAGGNGLSKATAVVLKIASDSGGVASEYVWVAHAYPGSKVLAQALTTWDHGKRYDVLTVQTAAQARVDLWFDISLMYK
jgi:hypothetical protein